MPVIEAAASQARNTDSAPSSSTVPSICRRQDLQHQCLLATDLIQSSYGNAAGLKLP
jgi:hypothetical protein